MALHAGRILDPVGAGDIQIGAARRVAHADQFFQLWLVVQPADHVGLPVGRRSRGLVGFSMVERYE